MRDEVEQWKLAKLRTHNALRPISRLPDELLARVFIFLHGSDSKRAVERAIQVCHRWRRVAFKQGCLWSDVKIIFSRPSLEKAEAYLARSGTSPIKIAINLMSLDHEFCRDLSDRIIVPYAARFTSFSFDSSSGLLGRAPLFPIPAPTPNLRSLRIYSTTSYDEWPPIFSQRNAEEVHLNDVQLHHGYGINYGTSLDYLSTRSLTSLTVTGRHDQAIFDLLMRCAVLKVLEWRSTLTPLTTVNPPHHREIHLPELLAARTLGVTCNIVASSLRAPNMQCLEWVVPDCGNQLGAVAPGLFSSHPRFPLLKNVYFQYACFLTPTHFSTFLAMHDALETLVLENLTTRDRSAVRILAQLQHPRRICPRLRHLYLGFTEPDPLNRSHVWPPHPAPNASSSALFAALLRILGDGSGQHQHTSGSLLSITISNSIAGSRDVEGIAAHPRVNMICPTEFTAAKEALMSI